MNLIILTESDNIGGGHYRLIDHRAGHIHDVLRLGVGEKVEAGLLNGPCGTALIESVTEREVILSCEHFEPTPDPVPSIDLICALPRPQTLKKVLLTSAMMGVRSLHLIRANRVEKSYFQSPLLEPANFMPYLIEGLSQGKLTRLPKVTTHDRFRRFFEDTLPSLVNETESHVRLLPDKETFRGLDKLYHDQQNILPAIGPEGGWVPFETELMERVGFQRFSLGRWTLRVETAVTAVLSQVELLRM